MIAYEDALGLVLATAAPLAEEEVLLADARGRALAADVASKVDSPPFNKSAMDGFAVRAEDVQSLPAELEVVGEVCAGQFPEFEVGPGQAARVMTGAPVPDGADTVVMVEHTEDVPGGRVRVLKLSGDNICPHGEDMRVGEAVLRAGEVLTPIRMGIAAAAGAERVTVCRRPRVALVCTGTEVVEPGGVLSRGQIYDSNGAMLSALLAPHACELRWLGIVGDEPGALESALREGLDGDLLVVSGGVSMGDYDLVPDTLKRLGVEQVFHKCAMKPGKPTFFGRREGALVLGMPGNPLSCFVVHHALVRPAIARMTGRADAAPAFRIGVMGEGFANKPGRRNFIPCTVEVREGTCLLHRTRSHGSADIVGAAGVEALVSLPPDCTRVEQGERVQFVLV